MKKSNDWLSALPDFHLSISHAINLSTRNGANEPLQTTLLATAWLAGSISGDFFADLKMTS
ncbi:hypothetical protein PMIT1313_00971 [Prochlorococcus marinus str. MIT 1313]|nr:hypothetical protein PMIT1313_00971 [Prochlorococcus marinus str. MIT 1313]KZR72208.1 hypothetical protein PMIT1318_01268 [Prochlorococcus marinus str. MIT 1318]